MNEALTYKLGIQIIKKIKKSYTKQYKWLATQLVNACNNVDK